MFYPASIIQYIYSIGAEKFPFTSDIKYQTPSFIDLPMPA